MNNEKQVLENLDKISQSARFMLSFVDDILNLSQIESGNVALNSQKVVLDAFLEETVEEAMRQAAERRVHFAVDRRGSFDATYCFDAEKLEQVRTRYASWEWRFGCTPSFNVSFENRFSFGCLELLFNVQGGVISSAVCYTDAMDATLALRLEELLTGSPYGKQPLVDRLSSQTGAEEREIAVWLGEQSI